ncbi:MAG: carbon-nitrogen hydrolase family protein [Planctomycetales bacterium]|nr:carbon-nitrogen hydrolase family protein [Planctomycetales bacterium]
MRFPAALIQMHVQPGDLAANLQRAEQQIARAAEAGAALAVLPEALDLGWTHPTSRSHATAIPAGEVCQRLAAAAARHNLYLCAGITEAAGDAVYNAAVLLDRRGRVVLHHRKLNELAIGHACYDQGDRLQVAHTELGVLGVMICADAFARGQVISRSLALMGAEVILSPCAWAVEANHSQQREPYGQLWRNTYIPVARDFSIWIAGVSNVGPITAGPWAGRRCIGCSLVVDPRGAVVVEGPYGADANTILYCDIEPQPRPARGDGWQAYWQSAEVDNGSKSDARAQ